MRRCLSTVSAAGLDRRPWLLARDDARTGGMMLAPPAPWLVHTFAAGRSVSTDACRGSVFSYTCPKMVVVVEPPLGWEGYGPATRSEGRCGDEVLAGGIGRGLAEAGRGAGSLAAFACDPACGACSGRCTAPCASCSGGSAAPVGRPQRLGAAAARCANGVSGRAHSDPCCCRANNRCIVRARW